MPVDLLSVLLLLAVAIVLFVIGRPRVDAVALVMIVALPLTGVITVPEALAGFSDPNIVLIAALFVLGEGLVRTGVAQRVGDWLVARGGEGEQRIVVLLMIAVGLMGAVMSSTAVVAIFIPIVLRVSQQTGIPKSRLLMPTSVAALVSGMLTLVATAPNLVVNSELLRENGTGFRFFSFTPFGLPILALAIGYMLLMRRTLGNGGGDESFRARPTLYDWIEQYRLHGRAFRLRVERASPLANATIGAANLDGGARVIAIERRERFGVAVIRALPSTELHADDVLLVDVDAPNLDLEPLCRRYALAALPMGGAYFTDHAGDVGMAETLVPPDSALVGVSARDSALLAGHGLTVVGLRHGRDTRGYGLEDEKLKVGDTLLVVGPWRALRALQSDGRDLITVAMPAEADHEAAAPAPRRAPLAVLSMALVIVLMLTGIVPNVQAAIAGCLLMGLFRCVDLDAAYRSIHWRSLVLIVGMLPFSLALQRTGAVDIAAQALLDAVGGAGLRAVLASVFALTAVIGLVISNTATAVLMTPVALALAQHLHASRYPFAMIVALASSTAFMTPISSPVNTLVSTAGNYSFGDFFRIGTPLAIVVMVVSVTIVPWLLPAW
jgi:di/tricarboxylate transporter